MIRDITPANALLWGRGMIAQLGMDMVHRGCLKPVAVCRKSRSRAARRVVRQLVPGQWDGIPVHTDHAPEEADFLLLVGGAEIAAGFSDDPRPQALIPVSDRDLAGINGPMADFLVVDRRFISWRSSESAGFLSRFARTVSDGAASAPESYDRKYPSFAYYNRTRVISGIGALAGLKELLTDRGLESPLILSDQGLTAAGLTARIESVLDGLDLRVFDDIPPDSDSGVVDDIVSLYFREKRDSLIALGGGSVLDTGKGVYLGVSTSRAGRPVPLADWAGSGRIPALETPFYAIPTTSGTGSEVTRAAVVSDARQGRKVLYISPHLQPDAAILDGSLSTGLPAYLTSITGMDALSHAVEAFTCLGRNPLSDGMAAAAIRRIRDNLIPLMDSPGDENRRNEMALAASMAGQAFSNSMVGMVHTIGHSVGALCHAPHGACMSVLLPVSLEYNRPLIASLLARLLPELTGEEASPASDEESAEAFITRVREMNRILREKTGGRHPERLRDLVDREGGKLVDPSRFEDIARLALGDGSIVYNPRELRFSDIMGVLEEAY